MFSKLWNKFFGVEGAALACQKPCYLWNIFPSIEGGWMFTYFNEDHTRGECRGPFDTEEEAIWSQRRWANANHNAVITQVQ